MKLYWLIWPILPGLRLDQIRHVDAGNDWWWAIDNLVVNAGVKPPSLVTSPSSLEVDEGSEATFSVSVDGSGPFKYEWFYNGESIGVYDSAESSNTLVISRASADDAGAYSVAVSNAGGATPKTANALLEVKAACGIPTFLKGGLPLGPNVDEALAGEAVWTPCPMAGLETTWTHPVWMMMKSVCANGRAGVLRRRNGGPQRPVTSAAPSSPKEPGPLPSRMVMNGMTGSPGGLGRMNTVIAPDISIAEVEAGTLTLRFNSSWRPENDQTGLIQASLMEVISRMC